ncbi:MAG TPA: ROK family protein [Bryobacteraceae bacterium]|nr:ROK family protein [Bryobacteraceae bacterium]
MPDYSIGVDLGGTNLRAAAIDHNGRILEKVQGSTQLSAGRDAVIGDIAASILKLRAAIAKENLVGIGIGVPGFIIMEKGVISASPNLPGFENFPIRDEIERLLQAPVLLENDANAAALGEKWIGAGRDVDDLLLLTLGTGIGGGIVSGGKVLHGFVGMAGEVGHITVVPEGNPCGCGNSGCLEKHASATAITAMAHMLGLGEHVTSKDVFDLAMAGNPAARVCFERMGWALGVALASFINILNFPLYLLSGGVLAAWDLFAPTMLAEVKRRSLTYRNTVTRIEKATLGSEAGLFGAAYLPYQSRIISSEISSV